MKQCNNCNEMKELELFQKDKRAKLGRRNRCKQCSNKLTASWKDDNPDYMQDYLSSYLPRYAARNRHKVNAKEALRRSRKLNQTPDLTAEEQHQIEQLYWLAKDLKAVSGEDYHVDHIIPLARGGLHHPDNLQVLPADLNLKKGAKV